MVRQRLVGLIEAYVIPHPTDPLNGKTGQDDPVNLGMWPYFLFMETSLQSRYRKACLDSLYDDRLVTQDIPSAC